MMLPSVFFKSLSDETRLHILMLLHAHEELCVCDITSLLELSQPKISRHLAQLRNLNILQGRKQGRWVYYRIHPDLPQWVRLTIENCAEGNKQQFSYLLDKPVTSNICE